MDATVPAPAALIFDLDGTLIDSSVDLATACNLARGEFSLPPLPVEVIRTFIGDGARKLVLRAFDQREDLVDDGLARFRAHYNEHLLDTTQPYPGVVETLEALSALPMAVVTNKPQEMSVAVIKGLGLDRFFKCIVGARKGVPVKPRPEMLEQALDALGCAAHDAWMIGDSANDVLVGRAVGAVTVAVRYGVGDVDRMLAAGPDVVLDDFASLLDAVSRARP